MQKSKIEWTDYTLNPVKGLCPVDCKDNEGKSYCYARKLYRRFKWNPEIRYDPDAFKGLPSKPARIFVGSTMELFGDWIDRDWMHMTFAKILARPQHTFIFLTKQPQNLIKWSPFPENCWVGVTATDTSMAWIASKQLSQIEAGVKFLSIEPLLSWETSTPYTTENIVAGLNGSLDWIIIGQQTPVSAKTQPRIEWLKEIVEAADRAGIKVFLKDNLRPLLIPEDCSKPNYLTEDMFWASEKAQLRQEMPEILYCSTCRVRRR